MRLPIYLQVITQLVLVLASDVHPVKYVDVPTDHLAKTGYWHQEYHDKCGVDILEAHGADASLSFSFYGTGVVVRLLACDTCSDVEVTINSDPPVFFSLSDQGLRCPTGRPRFVNTSLPEDVHTVTLKRLDDDRPLKVWKFEYLTSDPDYQLKRNALNIPTSTDTVMSAAWQVAQVAFPIVAQYALNRCLGHLVTAGFAYVTRQLGGVDLNDVFEKPVQAVAGDVTGSGEAGEALASLQNEVFNIVASITYHDHRSIVHIG
ncbi:hypothetical protein ONZ45_g4585 [Pleurotus djamor]|nr:hypothetical protein ONZ45_g4585 [Pleurotus djamor]